MIHYKFILIYKKFNGNRSDNDILFVIFNTNFTCRWHGWKRIPENFSNLSKTEIHPIEIFQYLVLKSM